MRSRLTPPLLFVVLIPALLFQAIGSSFKISEFAELWIVPVAAIIHTVIGLGLGWLTVAVSKPPAHFRTMSILSVVLGNAGNLPLSLVASMATTEVFRDQPDAETEGVKIISLYMIVTSLVLWMVGYPLMGLSKNKSPMSGSDEEDASGKLLTESSEATSRYSVRSTSSIEYSTESEAQEAASSTSSPSASTCLSSATGTTILVDTSMTHLQAPSPAYKPRPTHGACGQVKALRRHWLDLKVAHPWFAFVCDKVFTPPVVAVILGLVVAAIEPLADTMFGEDKALRPVGRSAVIMGNGVVGLSMLILGASLAAVSIGKSAKRISRLNIALLIFVRMVVFAAIGIGLLYVFVWLDVVDVKNKMLLFILMVQTAVPTAQSTVIIVELHGGNAGDVSTLLFFMYLASVPILTCSIALQLYVIESIQ
ncbi:uncharacterized protein AMSG_01108 [Thecamonas trahens ATCC 50062]|uniref:Auxin efflux carrier n=1 Tax=Thecamonas trahens ATCC 50062 TaxID=461836 RepID=A0A0L0DJK0_THETB|nr:hypothetical protein AMSG_01108 [Thecamonas trahens ATCC 50062]KNC52281.1 hypothetical protein AMSG_01108 [Thecamonas trahens ATCC 50062]|eukprot:XP_013762280.1 hypothetical protein AMSG_01108 [Thecamonas trahens ATCC 50062]